jgi:hypothetical protein
MKYLKLFESFNDDNVLKSWAYEYAKNNHDGLNSYDDAVEELDIFFESEYPNFQGDFELIRVLQIDEDGGDEIDEDDLGSHYIDPSYEDRIYDRGWYESINVELDDSQMLYLVKVKSNYDMVDWEDTIHNRLAFPREYEITLKDNPEVISIEEIDQEIIR